ncbi:MAG: L-seryl-tRNA(Sec) selenium transferase [Thermodesulfobacteriota bacterium]
MDDRQQRLLRRIPKVDELLGRLDSDAPQRLVKKAVRDELEELRRRILAGIDLDEADTDPVRVAAAVAARIARLATPRYRPVINATGVVVHTNLGRSLLPAEAMTAILAAGSRYGNLEFDLDTGKRGSRYSLVEDLLCELTGAEAALVVNNNAAAVLLVLETLARGREVIVSRGQLVEIGGSFRIPEVMAKSGAHLVEVGATNRTHPRDYENAITEATALLLKVHTSNYRMIGFTAEVPLAELVELGRRRDIPVMEDLGSGCLLDLKRYGFSGEPTVGEVVAAGADIVTFSGDKLLGGPQAGIIVGRRQYVERIKRNPFNRALRIDKFTLAGLESVLRLYLDEEQALARIPTLAMLALPQEAVRRRTTKLLRLLGDRLAGRARLEKVAVSSRAGGGSLPEQELPSWAVRLTPLTLSAAGLEERLRRLPRPVIGRIEHDTLLLDLRTVQDDELAPLAEALAQALAG